MGVLVQSCECFGSMCTCIYCVLYCLYCVSALFRLCLFLLVLPVLVYELPPSDNSIAVNNNNNNNNNNKYNTSKASSLLRVCGGLRILAEER